MMGFVGSFAPYDVFHQVVLLSSLIPFQREAMYLFLLSRPHFSSESVPCPEENYLELMGGGGGLRECNRMYNFIKLSHQFSTVRPVHPSFRYPETKPNGLDLSPLTELAECVSYFSLISLCLPLLKGTILIKTRFIDIYESRPYSVLSIFEN